MDYKRINRKVALLLGYEYIPDCQPFAYTIDGIETDTQASKVDIVFDPTFVTIEERDKFNVNKEIKYLPYQYIIPSITWFNDVYKPPKWDLVMRVLTEIELEFDWEFNIEMNMITLSKYVRYDEGPDSYITCEAESTYEAAVKGIAQVLDVIYPD